MLRIYDPGEPITFGDIDDDAVVFWAPAAKLTRRQRWRRFYYDWRWLLAVASLEVSLPELRRRLWRSLQRLRIAARF